MKVWITQDVFKKGIIILEVKLVGDNIVQHKNTFYRKPNWHESEESAKQQVLKMTQHKIWRLTNQIKKLTRLKQKCET